LAGAQGDALAALEDQRMAAVQLVLVGVEGDFAGL
jgi:hypothetical protein